MTKKILALVVCALLAISVFAIGAFAAEEPTVTNDTKAYISFQAGDNILDGLSSMTPKKQLLTFEDNGVVSMLKDGGTLVATGKLYIGGNYVLPTLGSALLITSNDGTTDFKQPLPDNNPDCAMKIAINATLTITSDVIIDDIILFQEHAVSNAIEVTNGATLVIGDNIVCQSNPTHGGNIYNGIVVREGCTAIVKAGTFQYIAGDGEIIVSEGVQIVGEAPEVLPTAIPEETEAPVESSEPAETGDASEPAETGDASKPAETGDTSEPEETTVTEPEETTKATKATETTPAETDAASTEEPKEDNTLLWVLIAAAVVVVAVVVVVVIKKKK